MRHDSPPKEPHPLLTYDLTVAGHGLLDLAFELRHLQQFARGQVDALHADRELPTLPFDIFLDLFRQLRDGESVARWRHCASSEQAGRAMEAAMGSRLLGEVEEMSLVEVSESSTYCQSRWPQAAIGLHPTQRGTGFSKSPPTTTCLGVFIHFWRICDEKKISRPLQVHRFNCLSSMVYD